MQAVIRLLNLNTNKLIKFINGFVKGLIAGALSLSLYGFLALIVEYFA